MELFAYLAKTFGIESVFDLTTDTKTGAMRQRRPPPPKELTVGYEEVTHKRAQGPIRVTVKAVQNNGKVYRPNGRRECERRMRQMVRTPA